MDAIVHFPQSSQLDSASVIPFAYWDWIPILSKSWYQDSNDTRCRLQKPPDEISLSKYRQPSGEDILPFKVASSHGIDQTHISEMSVCFLKKKQSEVDSQPAWTQTKMLPSTWICYGCLFRNIYTEAARHSGSSHQVCFQGQLRILQVIHVVDTSLM